MLGVNKVAVDDVAMKCADALSTVDREMKMCII